ncbi:uncharacterized protein B0J16DRAFT_294087 [Fusarium flagelliforme]|uniref:NB-ARC domain-containing protein n=1 Tax=Fusarium flagelliforme TaxID=2675880 RepID=A0A395MXC4_9HYPO|nr:uncharacterized protein B0J16DRAFT_294087 [Fusarium flagelliforme]KAH7173733.1 hypothetical protein B0J16DRAFT_294087 [Fusarium flagelliforme]RFN52578.1 hypothetical protein FIE12Z_3161 [Fusarium flagelliforme]
MLSSLRRAFRSKSASATANEVPVLEPLPKPEPRRRTVHLYSGIKTLHSSQYDDVDIVFVHGLKGDCLKTWTGKGTTEPWPKALLPLELGTARILTYSYDAIVASKEEVPSQNRISNHASNLVAALASLRQSDNTNERPIIFVCHSLGGLVCQDALVTAKQRSEQHLQDIANLTRGVIFLGTPHHGSSLAKIGELVSRSVGMIKNTNSDIVQVLTRDSEVLARIVDSFQALVMTRSRNEGNTIEITCFYEELPQKRVGLVVPKHSAILPGYISIGIHKNHSEMTKFNDTSDPGFVAICGELKRWMKKIQRSQGKFQKHSPATHYVVPYSYNPDFVGRSEILEVLKSQLGHTAIESQSKGNRRAALHGLGGVGKTQIALAYSHWLQEVSKGTSIFWVHASSAERFSEAYTKIAKAYKIPGHEDPSFDTLSSVKRWLESDESGQWMMIVDNADDMHLFFPQPDPSSKHMSNDDDSLAEFIPECARGTVLVTTRNMQVGSRLLKGKRPIEVGKMDQYEATQLLRQVLQQGDESLETLLQLSSRLESLPLALVQAAAFIQENCITVSEYLDLLNGSEDDLVQLLDEDFEALGRDSDTPRAVTQTWMLSFQQIERQHPFAGELLSLMSLFDRQAIPLEFLEFYGEERKRAESNIRMQLVKALGVLKAFCFIRAERGGDHNMHRLVQLVTRTWLAKKGTVAGYAREALQAVSEFYPYADFEEISTCTAYLAHAYSVLGTQKVESNEDKLLRASLLHRVSSLYFYQGRLSEAEKLQREGFQIRKELLGDDHAETLVLTSDLASSLRKQGEWEEAEKLNVSIVETWKRLRGEENHKTLNAMNDLALTYHGQDKLEQAKQLYDHVFEVRKRVLGADHMDTICAMDNLATTVESKEAEEMQKRVIEAKVRTYGEEHLETLHSKGNLALTLFEQGEVGEAEEIQVQILDTSKRVLGEGHPYTLTNMSNLGSTWMLLGKLSMDTRHLYPDVDMLGDARGLFQECVRLRTELLGPNHFDTVEARECLEDCEEAIEMADRIDANERAFRMNDQVEV